MKIYLNSCLDEGMETQENDTILVQPIFLLFFLNFKDKAKNRQVLLS